MVDIEFWRDLKLIIKVFKFDVLFEVYLIDVVIDDECFYVFFIETVGLCLLWILLM